MGDLRDALETVKCRKSFSLCHLIMKTFQLLVCSYMDRLLFFFFFHLK